MTDYDMPSLEEVAALRERAHEMRAEALRSGFAAFVAMIVNLPHRIAQFFGSKTAA